MPNSSPASASPVIRLSRIDNVGVARSDIASGQALGETDAAARQAIPRGHKVALADISAGSVVIKYGQPIGVASTAICAGEHVHLHNLSMRDDLQHGDFAGDSPAASAPRDVGRRTFAGYLRADGRVGTRNYIAIISSVNCSATVSRYIAEHFGRRDGLRGRDHIDGVVALTHGSGCAINTQGEGYRLLTRTLQGYARNPNVGGVLMIGLGCEQAQVRRIIEEYGLEEGPMLRTLTIQSAGGTRRSIEAGCEAIAGMLDEVDACRRSMQPLSHIRVGLQCGGSDGYSGISANPALGCAMDLLVAQGGTAVLSETPEIYGAEHLLTHRAASPEVAAKLLERIDWWLDYTARNGAQMNNNPSPGNKEGGLTTILEKSLGAVAKGGSTAVQAVYEYAERIEARGLVFMDTPGYDPVSVTGQVAGGCNLICFTTGRGSVSGFKPAPCIKIATNSQMYLHMSEDMDIDCGTIITGEQDVSGAGAGIFERIVAVASGEKTKSEAYDYGDNEFVPWQLGAIT
ncbi:MAG: UxaA family hydrolase [Steroidobacteraceae bacterium]